MALTETLHIDTVSAGRRHVEAVMPITSDVLQPCLLYTSRCV